MDAVASGILTAQVLQLKDRPVFSFLGDGRYVIINIGRCIFYFVFFDELGILWAALILSLISTGFWDISESYSDGLDAS